MASGHETRSACPRCAPHVAQRARIAAVAAGPAPARGHAQTGNGTIGTQLFVGKPTSRWAWAGAGARLALATASATARQNVWFGVHSRERPVRNATIPHAGCCRGWSHVGGIRQTTTCLHFSICACHPCAWTMLLFPRRSNLGGGFKRKFEWFDTFKRPVACAAAVATRTHRRLACSKACPGSGRQLRSNPNHK